MSALRKADLITDSVVAQILSQQHSGFSVWLGEPFCDAESSRFVARYIERGPVALEKLSVSGATVTYCTKDGALHEFDPLEFLALLTSDIPDTYESMTRYYGWYSCRARGERKKKLAKQNAAIVAPIPEPRIAPSSSWAACIKRIYEIDPLECPKCQAKMRIVAFMHDLIAIANITRSLGLPDFTAPPKIPRRSSLSKRAGEEPELCVDEIHNDDV